MGWLGEQRGGCGRQAGQTLVVETMPEVEVECVSGSTFQTPLVPLSPFLTVQQPHSGLAA